MNKHPGLALFSFVFLLVVPAMHAFASQLQWSSGYTAYWNNFSPSSIPWASVTEVMHFSMHVVSDGSVSPQFTTAASQALTTAAHQHGRKALLTVGGEGQGTAFTGATTAANLPTLVNNIVIYMTTYDYDGVDLDWEDNTPGDSIVTSQYVALAQALRNRLNTIIPRPMLTVAVGCYKDPSLVASLAPYMDQMNMMSYWWTPTTGLDDIMNCVGSVAKNKVGVGMGLGDAGGVETSTAAVKAKADYATSKAYGGVMEWLIENDYQTNGASMPLMTVLAPYIPSATISPDTTPPSTPTNLSAIAFSTSQINLSWMASTDPDSAVAGYKVFRNGTQIATTANTSYSDTGLTASTSYSYTVSAYNAAGKNSSQSVSASAVTQTSPTPPTIDNGPDSSVEPICPDLNAQSGFATAMPRATIVVPAALLTTRVRGHQWANRRTSPRQRGVLSGVEEIPKGGQHAIRRFTSRKETNG